MNEGAKDSRIEGISAMIHGETVEETSKPFQIRISCHDVPLLLVSHCGEYMPNGLTNAIRHQFIMIANDRQTFVGVR